MWLVYLALLKTQELTHPMSVFFDTAEQEATSSIPTLFVFAHRLSVRRKQSSIQTWVIWVDLTIGLGCVGSTSHTEFLHPSRKKNQLKLMFLEPLML